MSWRSKSSGGCCTNPIYSTSSITSEILASLDKVDHLVFGVVQQAIQAISATVIGLFVLTLLLSVDPLSAASQPADWRALQPGAARRPAASRPTPKSSAPPMSSASSRPGKPRRNPRPDHRPVPGDPARAIPEGRRALHPRAGGDHPHRAPRYLVEGGPDLYRLARPGLAGRPGGLAPPCRSSARSRSARIGCCRSPAGYGGWATMAATGLIRRSGRPAAPVMEDADRPVTPMPFAVRSSSTRSVSTISIGPPG